MRRLTAVLTALVLALSLAGTALAECECEGVAVVTTTILWRIGSRPGQPRGRDGVVTVCGLKSPLTCRMPGLTFWLQV